jgi:hypothetical protein
MVSSITATATGKREKIETKKHRQQRAQKVTHGGGLWYGNERLRSHTLISVNGQGLTYHEVGIGRDRNEGFQGTCHGRGDEIYTPNNGVIAMFMQCQKFKVGVVY